jgi:hypothetical protein
VTQRDVFVSYSQLDRDLAFEVVSHVESQGIGCWVAPRDISPAADWAAEIIDAIAATRVMVLLFSASANASPQVRREVERAVHKRVAVLPFRVEDVLPSDSLEYFLSTQHWLDAFPPPREPHYAKLCSHLSTILTANPTGSPSDAARTISLGAATLTHPPATTVFGGAELQHLKAELAAYIGPIARYVVKRAASLASGMDELIVHLGGEIKLEHDRRQFVAACGQLQSARN